MCVDRALPVYIVHWRAIDWCVETVASLSSDTSAATRITVIDNEYSGGTELRAQLPPTIRIIPVPRNTGYSGAANLALDDWLTTEDAYPMAIIASHDVTLPFGGIGSLESALRAADDIGVVGPSLEFLARYPSPQVGSTFSAIPTGAGAVHDCDWVSGTCMAIRLECALTVGWFDERFGSYTEDVDFCLRARDIGWRVVVHSGVPAMQHGSVDPAKARRAAALNSLRLARKRGGRRALLVRWRTTARRCLRNAVGSMAFTRPRWRRRGSRVGAMSRLPVLLRSLPYFVVPDRQLFSAVSARGSTKSNRRARG